MSNSSMMRHLWIGLVAWAVLATDFSARFGWAQSSSGAGGYFEETSKDFGAVPRGLTVSHPFRVVNNTKQNVVIGNVRVSCGMCSSARAAQSTLAPGQETAIMVTLNTGRFSHLKVITVYVQFNEPLLEEVRLTVQATSRDDVSFFPEMLNFGKIKRGTPATTSMNVSFFGDAQVQVEEARCDSNYVQPSLKEVRRQNGEVSYEISAKVRPDTPAGKWYTDVWLKTTHTGVPKLRVPVFVEIEAPVAVSPGMVNLGEIKAGEETERRLVLRGVRPFRITSITGTDDQVHVKGTANEDGTVHVLTITLNPQEPGDLSRTIRVATDLPSGNLEFTAQAKIMP